MRNPRPVPGHGPQNPQREPAPRPPPTSSAGAVTSPVAAAAGLLGSPLSGRPARPQMGQPRTPSTATTVSHQGAVRSDCFAF